MIFERSDWYVDDFLSSDGIDSEQAYFRSIISERTKKKYENGGQIIREGVVLNEKIVWG